MKPPRNARYIIVYQPTGSDVCEPVYNIDNARRLCQAWATDPTNSPLDIYREFERGPRKGQRQHIETITTTQP